MERAGMAIGLSYESGKVEADVHGSDTAPVLAYEIYLSQT